MGHGLDHDKWMEEVPRLAGVIQFGDIPSPGLSLDGGG